MSSLRRFLKGKEGHRVRTAGEGLLEHAYEGWALAIVSTPSCFFFLSFSGDGTQA